MRHGSRGPPSFLLIDHCGSLSEPPARGLEFPFGTIWLASSTSALSTPATTKQHDAPAEGPLVAIEDFYERYTDPSSLFVCDPPGLWRPADDSWCVGTDIDLMTTYAGGSREAVDALLADDQLEVLEVPDDQSVTWEADTVNPLPGRP